MYLFEREANIVKVYKGILDSEKLLIYKRELIKYLINNNLINWYRFSTNYMRMENFEKFVRQDEIQSSDLYYSPSHIYEGATWLSIGNDKPITEGLNYRGNDGTEKVLFETVNWEDKLSDYVQQNDSEAHAFKVSQLYISVGDKKHACKNACAFQDQLTINDNAFFLVLDPNFIDRYYANCDLDNCKHGIIQIPYQLYFLNKLEQSKPDLVSKALDEGYQLDDLMDAITKREIKKIDLSALYLLIEYLAAGEIESILKQSESTTSLVKRIKSSNDIKN